LSGLLIFERIKLVASTKTRNNRDIDLVITNVTLLTLIQLLPKEIIDHKALWHYDSEEDWKRCAVALAGCPTLGKRLPLSDSVILARRPTLLDPSTKNLIGQVETFICRQGSCRISEADIAQRLPYGSTP